MGSSAPARRSRPSQPPDTAPVSRPPQARRLAAIAFAAGRAAALDAACTGLPSSLANARGNAAWVLAAIDEATGALGQSVPTNLLFGDQMDPVADLAVVGLWTLQRRRAAILEALEAADPVRCAEECSAARRSVIRSLAAVERVLLESGAPPGAVGRLVERETERALAVRSLYRAFRLELGVERPPTNEQVDARMAEAAKALSNVIASHHFRDLRAGDRLLFRELLQRVEATRAAPPEPGSATAARRVWQDLAAFAGCLRAVNQRAELVTHDAKVAREALDLLPADDTEVVEPSVIGSLGSLLGHDDQIDEALCNPDEVRAGPLRELLTSIARLESTPEW